MKLILISVLLLTACGERPCVGPFPDHDYFKGEMALHIPTGENVRVLNKWGWLGGTKCQIRRDVSYTIRFSDGSEIEAAWSILEPIK